MSQPAGAASASSEPPSPEREKAYCRSFVMVSKDDDSPEMRCGVMGIFRQVGKKWIGITTFELFAKSWLKQVYGDHPGVYDAREQIVGKTAYEGKWLHSKKANITADTSLIKIIRPIGIVIHANPQTDSAFVLINEDIDMSGGIWTDIAVPATANAFK